MRPLVLTKELATEIVAQKISAMKVLPKSITLTLGTKLADEEKARVIFTEEAEAKIDALVATCKKEIAWHGIVDKTGDKEWTISDIIVFPQTVTGATVTTDDEEYTKFIMEMMEKGLINKIRFHGHSHVNMGVTPSGVDTEYYNTLTTDVRDYYIFGIFNKKGDWNLMIHDVENNILYENDDIDYIHYKTPVTEWAEQQIEELVTEKVVTSYPRTYTGRGAYGGAYGGYNYPGYDDDDDDYYAGYYGFGKGKGAKSETGGTNTPRNGNYGRSW